MEQSTSAGRLPWAAVVLLAVILLPGCQPAEPQPAQQQAAETAAVGPDMEPAGQRDTRHDVRQGTEDTREGDEKPEERPQTEPDGAREPGSQRARDKESSGETDTDPPGDREEEPDGQADSQRPDEPESEPDGQATPDEPDDPAGDAGLGGLFDQPESEATAETAADRTPDLGPPLVDNAKDLKRLDKNRPVWIDTKNKRVIVVGQICQNDVPLELFACLRETKEHEAIVTVDVKALTVHAGLLAVGAQQGSPAKWDPIYQPASGTEIEITLVWKDGEGKRQTARAQDWIRDSQTDRAMEQEWVFAGSGLWEDEETGQKHYQAEGGDFICVSNFTTAMLDLPIESSQLNDALMYHAFTERIPPRGTPVTLVLTPKLKEKEKE